MKRIPLALFLLLILTACIAPGATPSLAQPLADTPTADAAATAPTAATDGQAVAGAHRLAATKAIESYWLPGWGAVPPVRTEREQELVPDGLGWTQVWHYQAPTFEFAWQYREGTALENFQWPNTPSASSLVFQQGALAFSQAFVVEMAGEEYPLLPSPNFEVRSGTDGMDILRITGRAGEFDVTLDYFFDTGMPGAIIRAKVANNTDGPLHNARFLIRSTQRGPWDKFGVIERPGGEERPAVVSTHPQKALYFSATSTGEEVLATFSHSDDVSLYYRIAPGEWKVDATFNLFALAPTGEIRFSTALILLPAHSGVRINLKTVRLMLPAVFLNELPDYYNRGFQRVQSGILWTEPGSPETARAAPPLLRGLSLVPRGYSLPPRYSERDPDADLRRPSHVDRELAASGANLIVLGDDETRRETIVEALAELAEREVPHRWLLKQQTVRLLGLESEAQPTGFGFWMNGPLDVPWGPTVHRLVPEKKHLPPMTMEALREEFAGALQALWSAEIRPATGAALSPDPVVLWPVTWNRDALVGGYPEDEGAAFEALSGIDDLTLCLAYGGMDLGLLENTIREARAAGIARVIAGFYPEMWNDPGVVLRSLAAARRAGASGAVALSLTGEWPESTSTVNWEAWSVGTRAFFGGTFGEDEEDLARVGNLPELLDALSTHQWVIVASPLDQYDGEIKRLAKTVPNRYLQALNIAPSKRMRPGSIMVLIGTPGTNLEIAKLLKSEQAGFRLQDLEELASGEYLIGYGDNAVMITGRDDKGVKRGLKMFQEMVEMIEPGEKPELRD